MRRGLSYPSDRVLASLDSSGRSALGLLETDHCFVSLLGLLERSDGDLGCAGAGEGEVLAEPSVRAGSPESERRLIEARRLPDGAALPPVSRVAVEGVAEAVPAVVLAPLVAELPEHARRAQQRQAQGRVVRLVPAVLGVAQDRHSEAPIGRGEVGPLLSGHFVLVLGVVGPLDRAQPQVVGGGRMGDRQRESRLEQSPPGVPVDSGLDFQPISATAASQPQTLDEARFPGRSPDLEPDPSRTALDDPDLRRTSDPLRLPAVQVLVAYLPGRPSDNDCVDAVNRHDALDRAGQKDLVFLVH